MDIDYKKEFLECDFDRQLISSMSPFLNSQERYLDFKNSYLQKTYDNYLLFQNLTTMYNELGNNYKVNDTNTRHSFTFFDRSKLDTIRQSIKNLVIEQRTLKTNLELYIQYLVIIS